MKNPFFWWWWRGTQCNMSDSGVLGMAPATGMEGAVEKRVFLRELADLLLIPKGPLVHSKFMPS